MTTEFCSGNGASVTTGVSRGRSGVGPPSLWTGFEPDVGTGVTVRLKYPDCGPHHRARLLEWGKTVPRVSQESRVRTDARVGPPRGPNLPCPASTTARGVLSSDTTSGPLFRRPSHGLSPDPVDRRGGGWKAGLPVDMGSPKNKSGVAHSV